ncbi:hypothetical protein DY000_02032085 [Brassica cretica]|uniref:JAB1/MPN/MOV34 metalloenzyme domain-containing protein n=1 Tax=Brassica cretica TaxID=69181 RepID=A0ABQ7DVZ4_BRACR|nr:hypothetical protein DY000_02032085 [Brassica cretica]
MSEKTLRIHNREPSHLISPELLFITRRVATVMEHPLVGVVLWSQEEEEMTYGSELSRLITIDR